MGNDDSKPVKPADIPVSEIVSLVVEQAAFARSAADMVVLVQLLDAGYTPERVAQMLNIRLSTIYRMMARRDVAMAVERGREARVSSLRSQMTDAARRGVDVFLEVMNESREVAVRDEEGVVALDGDGRPIVRKEYVAAPETRMAAAEKLLLWTLGKPRSHAADDENGDGRYPPRSASFVQVNVSRDEGGSEGDAATSAFRRRLGEVLDADE
ncbi:MAG: hypothetical protein QME96_16840 [Myxococcota bacterium]|nr:hypothetical protein [Myxococcota bacterium]